MRKVFKIFVLLNLILLISLPVSAQNRRSVKQQSPVLQDNFVTYDSLEAYSDGKGVWIEWQTASETKNLGFFVYRSTGKNIETVSRNMIPGGYLLARENQTFGKKYTFFDPQGGIGSTYFIESLNTDGGRQISSPVTAKTVETLESVAGRSSDSLQKALKESNPQSERIEVFLPKELQNEVSENNLLPDIVTHRWVVSQPGVKIGVKKDGFYRVLKADLQAAGFDVNAAPNLWQLYLEGNELSINVAPNGDYIEFYGRGIDTLDSDKRIYNLIVGNQNGKRITSAATQTTGGAVVSNNYWQSFYRKDRSIYVGTLLNGQGENFFGAVVTGSGTNITFNLTGIDTTIQNFTLNFGVQGLTVNPHQVKVELNGTQIDTLSGDGQVLMSNQLNLPTSLLLEGANILRLTSLNGSGDINLFESVRVSYSRRFEAVQNNISFYTSNYKTSTVSGFTSANIRVFDMTQIASPRRIENLQITDNAGNFSVRLPATRGKVMFAVEDSGLMQAASIEPNTPSTLSTPTNIGSMIIITYKDWMTEANTWAAYRQADGLTVKVVDVEDIFDEFSYSVHSTDAIKGFLEYAKNNWQTPPNYVLMLGDATYDPRNFLGQGFANYVPTKIVDTLYSETGSDDALADFNNDGLAEISIGRVPARTASTVTQIFNKTVQYELTNANVFSRGAVFVSDLPEGYDFEAVNQRLRTHLPPDMPAVFINRGQADARTLLLAELNLGKFIVHYSGHGNTNVWATINFFSRTDAAQMANGNNYSFLTLLTCLNGYFIEVGSQDSLGEAALKAQNGGAVATWASSALTTPDVQEVMATRFYQQLTLGNLTRAGDLVKDAKSVLVGGQDVRLSWVLLGDPTLKMRQPPAPPLANFEQKKK